MNHPVRHVQLFVALALAAFVPLKATAQTSPIHIKAEVTGRTDVDRKKPPKKGGVIPKSTITEQKQLEIKLSNGTPNDFKGLTVKYYLFAANITTKEILISGMGEREVDLPGLGAVQVKSEQVSVTHTEQYQKKVDGDLTTVPPAGEKFKGYGVQVFVGDKLLAESFEPPEMRSKTGSAYAGAAGGKKKRKKSSD